VQKGQIFLGIGTVLLIVALYFGGNTVSKKDKTTKETSVITNYSFEQYEQDKLAKLLADEKTQFSAISSKIKATQKSDTAQLNVLYSEAFNFWKNLSNPALAAYYFYQSANIADTKESMENAGDALVNAYKSTEDSVILNNLITFALRSYEAAVQKDGSDVALKIKLADAYVQGSQEPMKGIELLRQLEDSLPNNIPVLLALGRLSIQSGQYEKAKERLKKVIQEQPQNTEALYFLAITEAQLGHKEEATKLFEMCKLLVNNEEFSKEIDVIIDNLKK